MRIFQFNNVLSESDARNWLQQNQERLTHAVVTPPERWRKAQINGTWFPRQCFPRSIQFLRRSPHLPEAHYVIGEAVCGGLQQHGWVEIGDVVFDAVQQEFYSREAYYQSEYVFAWYRFTRKATLLLSRRQEKLEADDNTYRWDWWLKLPWATKGKPPLTVNEEMARQYLGQWSERQRAKRFAENGIGQSVPNAGERQQV